VCPSDTEIGVGERVHLPICTLLSTIMACTCMSRGCVPAACLSQRVPRLAFADYGEGERLSPNAPRVIRTPDLLIRSFSSHLNSSIQAAIRARSFSDSRSSRVSRFTPLIRAFYDTPITAPAARDGHRPLQEHLPSHRRAPPPRTAGNERIPQFQRLDRLIRNQTGRSNSLNRRCFHLCRYRTVMLCASGELP